MRHGFRERLLSTAFVGGLVAILTAGQALADDPPPPRSSSAADQAPPTLGEVVVTASKVSQRELEVPTSETVLQGTTLVMRGETSLKDFAGFVPGLQFDSPLGNASPVIRGLSDGNDTSPTTGIVVNGAPIGTSSKLTTGGQDSLDLDPIDIARVEVLKGPQGTLYGANTLGGLISYTLQAPSLSQFEGIAQARGSTTAHGEPGYAFRGAVGGPIIEDKLGGRVSAYFDHEGGFIDDPLIGQTAINWSEKWGVSGALLFEPTSRLRVSLDGFLQKTNINDTSIVPYLFGDQSQPRDGDLVYDEYLLNPYRKTIAVGIANIDYNLRFADLVSITSYFYKNSAGDQNATGGTLDPLQSKVLPLFGGPPFPTPALLSIGSDAHSRKVTQEVRLTSETHGPLSWIVGAFYAKEWNDYIIPVDGRTPGGGHVPSLTPALNFNLFSTLQEYSAFGNLTYRFSPSFDVTGGLRVGGIDQTYLQLFTGSDVPALNALLTLTGSAPVPTNTGTNKSHDTVVTYLLTGRWHLSRNGMLYARFATGYRPGGPNVAVNGLPATFAPDQTQNYEVGLKTEFWRHRGTLELTGYYTDWNNIQVSLSAGGLTGFGNEGDARVYGVEAASQLRLTPHLSLDGTFDYSEGKITKAGPGAPYKAGAHLPMNPKLSGSLIADYRAPLTDSMTGYGSIAARFVGSRYNEIQNEAGEVTLPAYNLVDLHAGVEFSRYTLDLFVKNVTDERAQLASNSGFGDFVFLQRPRTIGIAVTARY